MAIAFYTYSIAGDTANGVVDIPSLEAEIRADGTPIPGLLGANDNDGVGDNLVITFAATLSGPQETALDAVVAAHEGIVTPAAASSNPAVTGKTRAATTADVPGTLSGTNNNKFTTTADGPLVADTVSLVAGDPTLFRKQTLPAQNGRWVVNVTGGVGIPAVLTRDDSAPYSKGTEFLIEEGATLVGAKFRVRTAPATPGTDPLQFAVASGASSEFETSDDMADVQSVAILLGIFGLETVDHVTNAALPAHGKVGLVLTASANGALTVDGSPVSNGHFILVKDEAILTHNGEATVTDAGSAGTPWVLTLGDPAPAFAGTFAGKLFKNAPSGTVNGGSWFICKAGGTAGTDPLEFTLAISRVGVAGTLAGLMSAADFTKLGTYPAAFYSQYQASEGAFTTTSITEVAAATLTFTGLVVGRAYQAAMSFEISASLAAQNAQARVLLDDTTEIMNGSSSGIASNHAARGAVYQFIATAVTHTLNFKLTSSSVASTASIRRMRGIMRRVD